MAPDPALATSSEQRAHLGRLLSAARLSTYADAASGGDPIELYAYNMAVAGALLGPLHVLEVVLRNAMSDRLTARAGRRDWWEASGVRGAMKPQALAQIAQAQQKVHRARRDPARPTVPDDVVAATDFGFWTDLTSNAYESTLWQDPLRHAFPHTRRSRRQIFQALQSRRRLRNRISHHEPVHDRDLLLDHTRTVELIGRISPPVARWVDGRSRLRQVVADRTASTAGPHRF